MAVSFAGRAEGVTVGTADRRNGGAAAVISDPARSPVAGSRRAPSGARRAAAPPRRADRRGAAAAAGRRRAGRRDGGAGRARQAPGRTGRGVLAVPPVSARRCRRPHRLARERQVATPLCPRNRMGSGAERMAVARCVGVDGLQLGPVSLGRRLADQARPGRADPGRAGEPPGARRRAPDPARQRHRADDRPGGAEPSGRNDREPARRGECRARIAGIRAAAASRAARADRGFSGAARARSGRRSRSLPAPG